MRVANARLVALKQLEFRVNHRMLSHGLRAWSAFHARFGKALEDAYIKQLEEAELNDEVHRLFMDPRFQLTRSVLFGLVVD